MIPLFWVCILTRCLLHHQLLPNVYGEYLDNGLDSADAVDYVAPVTKIRSSSQWNHGAISRMRAEELLMMVPRYAAAGLRSQVVRT